MLVLYIGIPSINEVHLLLFTFLGVTDELVNDLVVDKGKVKNKVLKEFLSYRLLLEIGALIVSIVTGMYMIFFALLVFDIGYVVTAKAGARGLL